MAKVETVVLHRGVNELTIYVDEFTYRLMLLVGNLIQVL